MWRRVEGGGDKKRQEGKLVGGRWGCSRQVILAAHGLQGSAAGAFRAPGRGVLTGGVEPERHASRAGRTRGHHVSIPSLSSSTLMLSCGKARPAKQRERIPRKV